MTFQEIKKKFDHLITLSSSTDLSNYLVIKVFRTSSCFSDEEILTIRNMLMWYAQKNDVPENKMLEFLNIYMFRYYYKSALRKASENNQALIFKYRPSEDVKIKYAEFREVMRTSSMSISSDVNMIHIKSIIMLPFFSEMMDLL